MTIDGLAKLAGVLGFFISLATFVITRWERRVVLLFGLDSGSSSDFEEEVQDPQSTANLTIANVGARSVILDLRTLKLKCGENSLPMWKEDRWGGQDMEVLVKPNDSYRMGIPLSTFLEKLRITSPERYNEKSLNTSYAIEVQVRTIEGKTFASKNLKFWEATGEFHRA